MVRNRYLRIERGRWLTEQGMSKNRCGQCGELKRGHVCKGPVADKGAFGSQEGRQSASRRSQQDDGSMPDPPFGSSEGGYPTPGKVRFASPRFPSPPTSTPLPQKPPQAYSAYHFDPMPSG